MPDPHALSNLAEGSSQMANPLPMMGYQSPATASPISGHFDFATPQMANAQIPDLKNVMFPSDNPFAYPNQPISTLESTDGSYSFPDHNYGSNDDSIFGTPTGGSTSTQMPLPTPNYGSYDYSFQQALNESSWLGGQPLTGGHGPPYGAPITDILMQNAIGGDHLDLSGMPMTMGDHDTPANSIGTGRGPTQGLQSNLDDYFHSEGWNPSSNPAWGEQHYSSNPQ